MPERRLLAQYEDVRRSGRCNMVDVGCVQRVANELGHDALVVAIEEGRYYELLDSYDADRAREARSDFDFTGGGP